MFPEIQTWVVGEAREGEANYLTVVTYQSRKRLVNQELGTKRDGDEMAGEDKTRSV